MNVGPLEIIAPDPRQHRQAVVDLCCKVFSGPNYYERFTKWNKYYFGSNYDWRASRIGLVNGKVVTHAGVWDYQMRIGSAAVRMGGVGAVATSGFFRKSGFMKQTMAACMEGMRAGGYDMSVLFGIRDFYYRFGYQFAWGVNKYCLSASDLPKEKPAAGPRKFLVQHRADIAAIYNRAWAGVTGSPVRPTFVKSYYPFTWDGVLWKDTRGRTVGYLIFKRDGRRMEIPDFGGEVEEALRVTGVLARRWGVDEITFRTLPELSPMAKRLRRMNCRVENGYSANGGPLAATVNLRTTLEKIGPVLAQRLSASPLTGWQGDLLVSDLRERVRLHISGGKVRVMEAPSPRPSLQGRGVAKPQATKPKHHLQGNDHLASLLIGADEPEETVRVGQMKVTGEAGKLITALFPNEHPMMSLCDQM